MVLDVLPCKLSRRQVPKLAEDRRATAVAADDGAENASALAELPDFLLDRPNLTNRRVVDAPVKRLGSLFL